MLPRQGPSERPVVRCAAVCQPPGPAVIISTCYKREYILQYPDTDYMLRLLTHSVLDEPRYTDYSYYYYHHYYYHYYYVGLD